MQKLFDFRKTLFVFLILSLFIRLNVYGDMPFYLSKTEITLDCYKQHKIELHYNTADKNAKVYWSSDNAAVATVSGNGTISGKSCGKAIITAKIGQNTAKCNVFVREIMPENISVNTAQKYLYGFIPDSKYIIDGSEYVSNDSGRINISENWSGKTVTITKSNPDKRLNSQPLEVLVPHIHFYKTSLVFKPTCLVDGYTLKACSCGLVKKDNPTSALGHKFSDYLYNGDFHYKTCKRENCDSISEREAHSFSQKGKCTVCGYIKPDFSGSTNNSSSHTNHFYDNNCDSVCNICGYVRKTWHIYDNSCDDKCNECGAKRKITHTFKRECSPVCAVCGYVRTVKHIYDNEKDEYCNICNYRRAISTDTTEKNKTEQKTAKPSTGKNSSKSNSQKKANSKNKSGSNSTDEWNGDGSYYDFGNREYDEYSSQNSNKNADSQTYNNGERNDFTEDNSDSAENDGSGISFKRILFPESYLQKRGNIIMNIAAIFFATLIITVFFWI